MTIPDLDYLVRLARRDRPPTGALEAVARRLRIPFVLLPAAAAVLPSSAFAAGAAKLGVARAWLLGGGAGGALVVGGAVALTVAAEPPSPVEPAAVVTPVVVSGPAALPAPSPPLEAPPSEVPAPAVAPERPKLREAPVAWDEPQLIERARKALGADPRRAFSLTQEYERRFPGGAMSVEREVIALEALARLGQREEARRRALSFEAAHPSSIHLPRVRALLAKLGPP